MNKQFVLFKCQRLYKEVIAYSAEFWTDWNYYRWIRWLDVLRSLLLGMGSIDDGKAMWLAWIVWEIILSVEFMYLEFIINVKWNGDAYSTVFIEEYEENSTLSMSFRRSDWLVYSILNDTTDCISTSLLYF